MKKTSRREKALEEFRSEQQFHEREWLIQRIGWSVLGALLLIALAGGFGSGPLSTRTIDVGQAQVTIDRFGRRSAPSEWKIEPGSSAANNESLRISLDAGFLEAYEISSVTPEPERTLLSGSSVLFEFSAREPSGSIVFRVEPNELGWHKGSMRVGASTADIDQFVYP